MLSGCTNTTIRTVFLPHYSLSYAHYGQILQYWPSTVEARVHHECLAIYITPTLGHRAVPVLPEAPQWVYSVMLCAHRC